MESPLLQLQVSVNDCLPFAMLRSPQCSLTGLQLDALLSETCLQPEELAAAQTTLGQLQEALLRIKPHKV